MGDSAPQGRSLDEANALLRELWATVQALRAASEQALAENIQLRVRVAALEARLGQNSSAAGLCRPLLALWPALWTFVSVPGVARTNNAAERAVRPAVLWRKQSLGTQTDAGNEVVCRLLSAATTCQQQERPLLGYLTTVCTAALRAETIPSLLSAASTLTPPATLAA